MKRENLITEHLAMGLLSTEKPLVYALLNTANYDGPMGYAIVAGETSDCLEALGCFSEDIEAADKMKVGEMMYGGWPVDKAILIIKVCDNRVPEEV